MNDIKKSPYVNTDSTYNNNNKSAATMIWDVRKRIMINIFLRLLNSFSCYFVSPGYDIEDFEKRIDIEYNKIKLENEMLKRLKEYLIIMNKSKDYEYIKFTQEILNQIELMINNRKKRFDFFIFKFFEEENPNLYPILDESQSYTETITNDLNTLDEHYGKRKVS